MNGGALVFLAGGPVGEMRQQASLNEFGALSMGLR